MTQRGQVAESAASAALDTGAAGSDHIARIVVGVISDTHGHLYPEVVERLKGVDHIIHAGDVGSWEVLRALRAIAPVTAVRGNVDLGGWADSLPSRVEVELGGVRVVVGHVAPRADGACVAGQPVIVVAGHSHIADRQMRGGVLFINPGSAGPRRFGRPRTMMRMEILPPREGDAASRVCDEVIAVESD